MFGCQTWQELWKVENHWITHLLISCPWPHYTKNKIDLLIVTFIMEYSLAPVYGQPHFALAPTHSPTRFPSPGFPNLYSLLLIHHTCSHPSVLIPLFTLHGTLISGFYYPLFSSSSLPSPARTPPSFLISLFLSLRFYLCLFLSSTSFFFFSSLSWFTLTSAESSSLTTLHQMGHFPCSYCIPHYPIYFLLTLVPIRKYVYAFFSFPYVFSCWL